MQPTLRIIARLQWSCCFSLTKRKRKMLCLRHKCQLWKSLAEHELQPYKVTCKNYQHTNEHFSSCHLLDLSIYREIALSCCASGRICLFKSVFPAFWEDNHQLNLFILKMFISMLIIFTGYFTGLKFMLSQAFPKLTFVTETRHFSFSFCQTYLAPLAKKHTHSHEGLQTVQSH